MMAEDVAIVGDPDVAEAVTQSVSSYVQDLAHSTRPLEVRRPYVDLGTETADLLLHRGLQVDAHITLLEAEYGALRLGIVTEFDRFLDLLVITRDRVVALIDDIEAASGHSELPPGAAAVANRHGFTIRTEVLTRVDALYEATVEALAA